MLHFIDSKENCTAYLSYDTNCIPFDEELLEIFTVAWYLFLILRKQGKDFSWKKKKK